MSAGRKQGAVLRLLRGEALELVSRALGVTAAELSGWREAFLTVGEASLKSRPADGRDLEIGRLKAKVGDLTMTAELLEAIGLCPIPRRDVSGADRIERLEDGRPSGFVRSPGGRSAKLTGARRRSRR
jgi:hypothetical protein